MAKQHSIRVYLNEKQIRLIRTALGEYYDYCGEVVADWKHSNMMGTTTKPDVLNCNEALEDRHNIQQLLSKIR